VTHSIEQIPNEYRKLRETLGRPPTAKAFFAKAPVSRYAADLAFGSRAFSKIQQAAGDTPRRFGMPGRSVSEYFETYGYVVRDLGAVPTEAEWKHRRMSPSVNSYCGKLGLRWSEMPGRFQEWASDKPRWRDVVHTCAALSPQTGRRGDKATSGARGSVYLIKCGRHFKIGKTNAVGRREYELGLLLPQQPKTVHVIETDDPAGVEAYWHRRFESRRKRGEWFQLTKDDVNAFKRWKSIV